MGIRPALFTGCRLSEIVGLNVCDFRDLEGTPEAKTMSVHGRGDKSRILIADPPLVRILTKYLSSRITRLHPQGNSSNPTDSPWGQFGPHDSFFVGLSGDRITGTTVQYRIHRAYQRAGIENHRPPGALVQQLRHTCALHLVQAGIDPYTLKHVLGHETTEAEERYVVVAGQPPPPLQRLPVSPGQRIVKYRRVATESSAEESDDHD